MYDVVALNNLCVDIVVPVDELPPPDVEARERLLQELASSNPSRDLWEVGGTTNFLISAARLGMKAASIGHANDDQYGEFLENVLKVAPMLALLAVLSPATQPPPPPTLRRAP